MAEAKKVRLAVTGLGTDVFEPSVEGVEPITREGTDVPEKKEQEVRNKARDEGVSLRKVG